jgi:hypothetical protein
VLTPLAELSDQLELAKVVKEIEEEKQLLENHQVQLEMIEMIHSLAVCLQSVIIVFTLSNERRDEGKEVERRGEKRKKRETEKRERGRAARINQFFILFYFYHFLFCFDKGNH